MEPKAVAASVILVNNENKILMCLRDNKKGILYPNCWDLIGGEKIKGETPYEAVKRECLEEIGICPCKIHKFMTLKTPYHIENVYWSFFDKSVTELTCGEGQKLAFLTPEEIQSQNIAFNFKHICLLFLSYINGYRKNE